MSAVRARKQWKFEEQETITTFKNCISVILHNISLDNNWAPFAADNFTWLKKSNAQSNRRMSDDGDDVAQANRRTAVVKCTQLELMLGYIAGYAHVLSPNSIVKNSISLPDI